jgi:hypothetical protein
MSYTIHLTNEEVSNLKTVTRFGDPIQDATINLRERTGIRYSVNVGKGLWNIVTIAYALNKKGIPHGASKIDYIVKGLSKGQVVNELNKL